MQALLKASNIELKTPQNETLLSGLKLNIMPGELCIIKGDNGSGKSSLIRALLQKTELLSGDIQFNIKNDRIAYLNQLGNIQFLIPMSLRKVLELKSLDIKELQNNFKDLLPNDLDRAWNTSSGGERQRCLLCACLNTDADLIILDEPFNHLDENSKEQLISEIQKVLQKNISVILISHEEINISYPKHEINLNEYRKC